MKRLYSFILILPLATAGCRASDSILLDGSQEKPVLKRNYKIGEQLRYKMKASSSTQEIYQAITIHTISESLFCLQGRVCADDKDKQSFFYEKIRWESLINNGCSVRIPDDFTQSLSLELGFPLSLPQSEVSSEFRLPLIDQFNIFSAASPNLHQFKLNQQDEAFHVDNAQKLNSWSKLDNSLIMAENCVDFDFRLAELTESYLYLYVKHSPPSTPCGIVFPNAWMQEPVKEDQLNNWIEIRKIDVAGIVKYSVTVGVAQFDVHLKIDRSDGKILFARMNYLVNAQTRTCADETYQTCDEPAENNIFRKVRLELEE